MKVAVVHLSDIHIDDVRDNPVQSKADVIASACFSHLAGVANVFIVVSGDITQSGKVAQYETATKFLRQIETALRRESDCEVAFVLVPGNHDCDFNNDSKARSGSVMLIGAQGDAAVDDSTIEVCTSVQDNYFQFLTGLEGKGWDGDRLWRSRTFDLSGKFIGFETLNVSWLSSLEEKQGMLFFPHSRYENRKRSADVNLMVMHHPFNWFNQAAYREFRRFIRSRATILFTGHEHEPGVSEIDELESGKSIALEGSVLQHSKGLNHTGFNLVLIDLSSEQYQVTNYIMDGDTYASQGMGAWSDYRPLPEKSASDFCITEFFQCILDDPGAYLPNVGNVELTLPDIYVYPDLRPFGDVDQKNRYVSSTTLLAVDALESGVLIQGEERAGVTSLLYQLFREHHDRGNVPLYLSGHDIRRTADSEIDRLINRAVVAQYGDAAVQKFSTTSKHKKVLLLDDFDDCPLRGDAAKAQIVAALKQRFTYVVVAVGPLFELKEIASDGALDAELKEFAKFQLQVFGNVRRAQLVRRWFEFHSDMGIDDGEFIGKCDAAEKLINSVMNRSIIPHTPLYMLTLLQSIESGRSGEIKDSALGHYYHFLLTSALQREGVKSDRLNLYYQYCAHLAWEFHISGEKSLDLNTLKEFNLRYSSNWSTVELTPTLDLLVRARVLSGGNDFYAFRYPYIYYFLKGYYINEYMDVDGMRDYVRGCCQHLYVRDNANTILFLAHHATGDFVVSRIAEALHGIFAEIKEVELEGDTAALTSLIARAPELSYSGGDPREHRRKRDEIDDEKGDPGDGLMEDVERGEKLSLAAKLATVMKTCEILGQVLKDQYAKIARSRKEELIVEIFDGSLRAMGDFFAFITNDSEKIVGGLREKFADEGLEPGEESEKEARLWVANLIQAVIVGLVMRAAQNTGSDDLREEIASVVERNGTMAYKLIRLATFLDSARPIPRPLIEQIYGKSEGNIVVRQVLMLLVLHRLYMFKTTEADMRWLTSKIKLRMDFQKALAYHRDEMKMAL